MKKAIILAAGLLTSGMAFSCCASSHNGSEDKSDDVRVTIQADNFNEIHNEAVADIIFTQADETSITVSGKERLVNNLSFNVRNHTLCIDEKENIKRRGKHNHVQINISSPALSDLHNEGVGNFKTNGKLETEGLKIHSEGVGNIIIGELECKHVTVHSEGVGNVNLQGEAQSATYHSEGVGNIDAQNLKAQTATASLEGVGNIKCHASKNLEAHSEGIGNIQYYGNPANKSLNKEGIGSIKQK